MRLIIDIPKEAYKTIMNTSFVRDVDLTFKQSAKDIEQTNAIFSLIDALDNGTPISDNVTNGAVLDKIRAEIDVARFIDKDTKLCKNANASGLEVAMQIIDKYR